VAHSLPEYTARTIEIERKPAASKANKKKGLALSVALDGS